jgi:AAA domain
VLTITGYKLDTVRELTGIDKVIDWGVTWGERRKAAAKTATINGHHFNGNGCGYSIDQIEQIVQNGAPEGTNRSDLFHTIVGHYVGCGWTVEQILQHLQQYPHGIGERYLHENRLRQEIARSAGKFTAAELPSSGTAWSNDWDMKAPPQPEPADQHDPGEPDQDQHDDHDHADRDDELDDDHSDLDDDLDDDDPDLDDDDPDLDDDDPDLDDDLDDDLGEEPRQSDLPPMYCHGDPDPRPIKSWAIKRLMATVGHGVLGGQWGTFKTFIAFDLAACLMTGQPFLGHPVKRQCGVLFLAAEGADEVRLRAQAVVNAKCGNMPRAPFCWYETAPTLLHKNSVDKLVAMGQQADAFFQKEFGLSLGLIIIDTMAVAAGYHEQGAENDSAVVTAIMRVLKDTAERLGCFVLGVDHYGKNIDAGLKGSVAKETQGDLILVCLGERERSGRVINTRLAVRKCRGGPQGQEFPFTTRVVEHPEKDEDGEPITTLVIDWQPAPPGGAQPQSEPDPWGQCRRQDQRTAVLRLKRVLMTVLADQGVELPIPPHGPVVRVVDQEMVRQQFYSQTSAEGTPKQKRQFRHLQFRRALGWAEDQQLIGIGEIGDIIYVWLVRLDANDDEARSD